MSFTRTTGGVFSFLNPDDVLDAGEQDVTLVYTPDDLVSEAIQYIATKLHIDRADAKIDMDSDPIKIKYPNYLKTSDVIPHVKKVEPLGGNYYVTEATNMIGGHETDFVYIPQDKNYNSTKKHITYTVEKGDYTTTPDITGVATFITGKDGYLKGLTTNMEYRKSGTSEWKSDGGVNLSAGNYDVRYKENDYYNSGTIKVVEVPSGIINTRDMYDYTDMDWTKIFNIYNGLTKPEVDDLSDDVKEVIKYGLSRKDGNDWYTKWKTYIEDWTPEYVINNESTYLIIKQLVDDYDKLDKNVKDALGNQVRTIIEDYRYALDGYRFVVDVYVNTDKEYVYNEYIKLIKGVQNKIPENIRDYILNYKVYLALAKFNWATDIDGKRDAISYYYNLPTEIRLIVQGKITDGVVREMESDIRIYDFTQTLVKDTTDYELIKKLLKAYEDLSNYDKSRLDDATLKQIRDYRVFVIKHLTDNADTLDKKKDVIEEYTKLTKEEHDLIPGVYKDKVEQYRKDIERSTAQDSKTVITERFRELIKEVTGVNDKITIIKEYWKLSDKERENLGDDVKSQISQYLIDILKHYIENVKTDDDKKNVLDWYKNLSKTEIQNLDDDTINIINNYKIDISLLDILKEIDVVSGMESIKALLKKYMSLTDKEKERIPSDSMEKINLYISISGLYDDIRYADDITKKKEVIEKYTKLDSTSKDILGIEILSLITKYKNEIAVDEFLSKISGMTDIKAILELYNKLTDEQKKLVPDDIKQKIWGYKDTTFISELKTLIDGAKTIADMRKIVEIYNNLTVDEKSKVSVDMLTKVNEYISRIKAYEFEQANPITDGLSVSDKKIVTDSYTSDFTYIDRQYISEDYKAWIAKLLDELSGKADLTQIRADILKIYNEGIQVNKDEANALINQWDNLSADQKKDSETSDMVESLRDTRDAYTLEDKYDYFYDIYKVDDSNYSVVANGLAEYEKDYGTLRESARSKVSEPFNVTVDNLKALEGTYKQQTGITDNTGTTSDGTGTNVGDGNNTTSTTVEKTTGENGEPVVNITNYITTDSNSNSSGKTDSTSSSGKKKKTVKKYKVTVTKITVGKYAIVKLPNIKKFSKKYFVRKGNSLIAQKSGDTKVVIGNIHRTIKVHITKQKVKYTLYIKNPINTEKVRFYATRSWTAIDSRDFLKNYKNTKKLTQIIKYEKKFNSSVSSKKSYSMVSRTNNKIKITRNTIKGLKKGKSTLKFRGRFYRGSIGVIVK